MKDAQNVIRKSKKVNKSPGAPKAIIDWKKVDDLLIAGCSGAEIAAYIGVAACTVYDRCMTDNKMPFAEYSQQKYAKGESLLRAHQYYKALGKTKDGDNTLLIWLGKNRLGQVETPSDTQVNSDLSKNFDALMTMITKGQSVSKSDLNSAEISNIKETKS
jgi:hypothetical protein